MPRATLASTFYPGYVHLIMATIDRTRCPGQLLLMSTPRGCIMWWDWSRCSQTTEECPANLLSLYLMLSFCPTNLLVEHGGTLWPLNNQVTRNLVYRLPRLKPVFWGPANVFHPVDQQDTCVTHSHLLKAILVPDSTLPLHIEASDAVKAQNFDGLMLKVVNIGPQWKDL